MNRLGFLLAATVGLTLGYGINSASADTSKGRPHAQPHAQPARPHTLPGHAHVQPGHGHGVRPVPYTQPRRVAPPVITVPRVVAVAPVAGGQLTSGAWVGYNSITGRYSVAFDSPGVSGMGILLTSGYNVIVRGPTTWTDAVSYLKSVGAPGW